jgi:RNA polymerase sigma-70 factor (ECF subfamily)
MRQALTDTAQTDDHELIRAFQAGDGQAFEMLVGRHKDRLFNLCFWFLGDYQEADDICQEVFIKIFQSLSGFRYEASFATWSYRVAVNACKNRVKSLAYRMKKWSDQLEPGAGPALEAARDGWPVHHPGPDRELEKKELAEEISRAVNALAPEHRTVIVLRDIEGLSYEEIARVTGAAAGTVKSRLARARSKVRRKLGDFY